MQPEQTPAFDPLEHFSRLESQFEMLKAQVRQAQQLSTLGTAAATIAHEVNNLLTPIVSYTQTALQENDSALKNKALEITLKNSKMLVAMSERLLEISAAKPAQRESVPIRAAAEDALASLCRDLHKDSITFVNKVEPDVSAWADRLQLQQVLFNLFLNAREAMAAAHGGRLTVTAETAGDCVRISIRNTGEPIPAELLPHIFEAFQSSKPSSQPGRQRCSGLGLSLCRDLVAENGGTIEVSSESDRGTTFTITLPREPVAANS